MTPLATFTLGVCSGTRNKAAREARGPELAAQACCVCLCCRMLCVNDVHHGGLLLPSAER